MKNDMKLPEGKKAKDCFYFKIKCSKMFGCKKNNNQCYFSPSKFISKDTIKKIKKELKKLKGFKNENKKNRNNIIKKYYKRD